MSLSHLVSILRADEKPKSCKASQSRLLIGNILIISVLIDILYVQVIMYRLFPLCDHNVISIRLPKQVMITSSTVVKVLSVVLQFYIDLSAINY